MYFNFKYSELSSVMSKYDPFLPSTYFGLFLYVLHSFDDIDHHIKIKLKNYID